MRPARSAPIRDVELGPADITVEGRAGGVQYVRSPHPLGPYPKDMTEPLEHWAAHAPNRTFLAERRPDGAWRHLTFAAARDAARRLGQAIVDRRLSVERPLAIISGNDIE